MASRLTDSGPSGVGLGAEDNVKAGAAAPLTTQCGKIEVAHRGRVGLQLLKDWQPAQLMIKQCLLRAEE